MAYVVMTMIAEAMVIALMMAVVVMMAVVEAMALLVEIVFGNNLKNC